MPVRARTVLIGSDHTGFDLKKAIKSALAEYEIHDIGTHDREPVDYPDIASKLTKRMLAHTDLGLLDSAENDKHKSYQANCRGILICGSGVGISVAANKLPGIRAGLCHDSYSARQGVEHDDMNVLVLGARIIGTELAKLLVCTFLEATFSNEPRHERRLEKLRAIESKSPQLIIQDPLANQ